MINKPYAKNHTAEHPLKSGVIDYLRLILTKPAAAGGLTIGVVIKWRCAPPINVPQRSTWGFLRC